MTYGGAIQQAEEPGYFLGIPCPLLEFLDDVTLLLVLGRPLGSCHARGLISLLALGDLVARLSVRLVPLALFYVAPAVYAHASPFSNGQRSLGGACFRFKLALLPVIPEGAKRKPYRRDPYLSCSRAARDVHTGNALPCGHAIGISRHKVLEVALAQIMSLGGVSSASAKSRRKGRLTLESLRDATVVITGAYSGIGLATARAFARRRANVVLGARRHALLQQAARDCEALGGRSLAVTTDVTDPAQVRELARAAASAFGGIDVWINNAGTSMWGPFEAIPLESQARLIEINLLGAINGSHAALPHFFDQGGRGVIINVVSIFGRVPMSWAASYSASKFGLAGFTEALRSELAAHSRIKVCGVYPAYVDTPTYLNSANYTGRALRPVPPVVAPERVAERIVGLALRPRRSTRVGALHASAIPYALAPDSTGRLVGRLGRHFLFRSGPPADASDGGLFETVAGRAEARGDWGMPERRRARRAVAIGAALAAGASALLFSRIRGVQRLAPALRR